MLVDNYYKKINASLKKLMLGLYERKNDIPLYDLYLGELEKGNKSTLYAKEGKFADITIAYDFNESQLTDEIHRSFISTTILDMNKYEFTFSFVKQFFYNQDSQCKYYAVVILKDNKEIPNILCQFITALLDRLKIDLRISHYPDYQRIKNNALNFIYKDIFDVKRREVVIELSSLFYESAESKGKIILVENDSIFRGVKLKRKLAFTTSNSRQIRKLFQMTNKNNLLIVSQNGNILGVGRVEDECIIGTIDILGHLSWQYKDKQNEGFLYKNGDYKIPYPQLIPDAIIKEMSCLFGDDEEFINRYGKIVEKIILVAEKKSHGTVILIAGDAENETKRLVEKGRGISIKSINLTNKSWLISSITAIDGAFIICPKGVCYGIGIILDGEAVITGLPERGARYNSTYNYVAWKKHVEPQVSYLAIIISEDRMIDVISSSHFDN